MDIKLKYEEIRVALEEYVRNQGFPTKNREITIEIEKSGRGENSSFQALITIEPKENHSEEPAVLDPVDFS